MKRFSTVRRAASAAALPLILTGSVVAQNGGTPSSDNIPQIPVTNALAAAPRSASLNEFLVSRLRVTTADQRAYIAEVVKLVDQRKLEKRLVLALERYSSGRNPYFPLPIFERVLRAEGGKRGVDVPTLREIVARNGASNARAVRDLRLR